MNINEEGKYYASMARKFRTEYKSKYLCGFCKEQIGRLTSPQMAAGYYYCLGVISNDLFLKDIKSIHFMAYRT